MRFVSLFIHLVLCECAAFHNDAIRRNFLRYGEQIYWLSVGRRTRLHYDCIRRRHRLAQAAYDTDRIVGSSDSQHQRHLAARTQSPTPATSSRWTGKPLYCTLRMHILFFFYSISSLSRVQKHSVGGAPPHRENRSRIFNILIFELEIVFAWRAEFHPLAKFEFCLFSFTNNWRRAKCFCKAKKICDSRWTSSCISFICFRRSTPLVYTFSVFGRLYI